MTNRKNLKIDPETYSRLKDLKGEYETWDGFLHRSMDIVEEHKP